MHVKNPRNRVVAKLSNHGCAQRGPPKLLLEYETSGRNDATQTVLPRNLSWLWKDELAVSSTPKNSDQIRIFAEVLRVSLVITLTEEQPLPDSWFGEQCRNHFVSVPNFCPPTLVQMDRIGDEIVRTVVTGHSVLEHCGGGKGRAGTVAACLLLRFGSEGILARLSNENEGSTNRLLLSQAPFMSSEEAVQLIRARRPQSIETEIQEEFVRVYAEHLWRIYKYTDTHSSIKRDLVLQATASTRRGNAPKYVVLMGLPGSGKSTLARLLEQYASFVHAEQDEMGHRACVDYCGRMAAKVSRGELPGLVVDCTNVTHQHRRNWLDILHQPSKHEVALVWMTERSLEGCILVVTSRIDHKSIPYGRGESVVRGFDDKLVPPTQSDTKCFGLIRKISSERDLVTLLSVWGIVMKSRAV